MRAAARSSSAERRRRRGFVVARGGALGSSFGWDFSAAESARILPLTAVWLSRFGITSADGGTTVQSWASSRGGIACTLDAALSVNRPAYLPTGGPEGVPLLSFDGAAASCDVLRGTLTKGSAWASYELGIVGSRVAFSTLGDTWLGYSDPVTSRFNLQDQDAGRWRWSVLAGANVVSVGDDPDGVLGHRSGDAEAGTMNARLAGAVIATAAGTVTSRADGGVLYLGGLDNGTIGAQVDVVAAHAGPALSADQRIYLRALLTFFARAAA